MTIYTHHRFTSLVPFSSLLLALTIGSVGCFGLFGPPRSSDAPAAVSDLLQAHDDAVSAPLQHVVGIGAGAVPEISDRFETVAGDEHEVTKARLRLLEAAATIGAPPEVLGSIFAAALQDSSAAVRQSAAFRAGSLQNMAEYLAPHLRKLLTDKEPQVRAAAFSSLSRYLPPYSLTSQELLTGTKDEDLAVAAGASAIAIRSAEPALREAAQQTLTRLVAALESPAPATRAAIVYAFGQYGKKAEPVVKPLTIFMLREKVPEVRLQAAMALLRIGTPAARRSAVPVLKTFSKSKNPTFQKTATEALKLLQAPLN